MNKVAVIVIFLLSLGAGFAIVRYVLPILNVALPTLPTITDIQAKLTPAIDWLKTNWAIVTPIVGGSVAVVSLIWNKVHTLGLQKKQQEMETWKSEMEQKRLQDYANLSTTKQQLQTAEQRIGAYEVAVDEVQTLQNKIASQEEMIKRLQTERNEAEALFKKYVPQEEKPKVS